MGGFSVPVQPNDLETGLSPSHPLSDEGTQAILPANSTPHKHQFALRCIFAMLIVLVGGIASASFLAFGITGAQETQRVHFRERSNDISKAIEGSFKDFELFGLWMHESCAAPLNKTASPTFTDSDVGPLGMCSRQKFRHIYEYIQSVGLLISVAQFIPLVQHEDRAIFEEDAKKFYAENHPEVDYQGFKGFHELPDKSGYTVGQQPEASLYAPLHYIEPLATNENAIDLNLLSHPAQGKSILSAIETWKPTVTERLSLVQDKGQENVYSVALRHPGVPTSTDPGHKPTNLANLAIRVRAILERAGNSTSSSAAVILYDATDTPEKPVFLGGLDYQFLDNETIQFVDKQEMTLPEFGKKSRLFQQVKIHIADRTWIVAVGSLEGTFEPEFNEVVVGGIMIVAASALVAAYYYKHMVRTAKQIRSAAEAEKAAIILHTAQQQARNERQLNDYIAHEVRNPLASAIAALSFIGASVNGPLTDPEKIKCVQEDISTCDSSLQFINDLLRNMLEMHRASSKELVICEAQTDIRNDILEPVAAILYIRKNTVQVSIHCPQDLMTTTDRLRLKQIVLNLVTNASKFVTRGFIRIGACVENGNLQIFIEDSGPGIPKEKRENLFEKYQESLDLLRQGTGIGLSLCKHLSRLMGYTIRLDDTFQSGIEGCPGVRFVIDLNKPPETSGCSDLMSNKEVDWAIGVGAVRATSIDTASTADQSVSDVSALTTPENTERESPQELPTTFSVLFVDDDTIVRKLFLRAVRRIAPSWSIHEAANGETALQLVDTHRFDLIFMDQYMASAEKQLLGTETVRALRAKGVSSRICGLSANDVETEFLDVGADKFMMKPFPVKPAALTTALLDIINSSNVDSNGVGRPPCSCEYAA